MKDNRKSEQYLRLVAGGSVTVFMILTIFLALMKLTLSVSHFLWGLPVIAVSLMDIFFLTRSLIRQPKNIDTRISSLLIGLGTTFGFSVLVMVFSGTHDGGAWPRELHLLGVLLSLLPYPFVIWSLFCLGNCLTVVPEAHAVVAHGPYRYSRHPLYVCYMVWAVANALMFPGWPMLLAAGSQIVCLLIRLRREEALLLRTFPEYSHYYERTGLVGNWL